jgi:DNA mismatch repair protein MutL
VLAPDVIDKIAAGEVLERPANLVKELIENSLDAGADLLEVEFDGGGRAVSVYDNGGGITCEEMPLALQRHATSKIKAAEDIYDLHTFGFRGEALASVAAVSKLTLTSRARGSAEAFRLISDYGKGGDTVPVSAREGTEVRIEGLFENVPARLRFMKSEAAENGQIKTALKALALANESVAFRARSRGEMLFHWAGKQSFQDRALQVLQVKELFFGSGELGEMKAEVLVSSPQETMNVNRNMWFFVQGRWVQDRSLSAAVMEAYRNLLMHGEYPSVVVRLTLPPDEVDVNVHPTKAQVKFRDSQNVFRLVCRTIRSVLEKAPWLKVEMPLGTPMAALEGKETQIFEADTSSLKFDGAEFERTQYSTKAFPLQHVREAVEKYSATASASGSVVRTANRTEPVANVDAATATTAVSSNRFRWSDLQVIGQLNHTYILAQTSDGFYMVDQHAAHERIVFERLMNSFRSGKIEVQNLLLPMTFDFSAEEVEALHYYRENIERMGLSIERMGPESVAVQAIPSIVKESAVSEALQKLAYEIIDNGDSLAWEKVVGEIFASMACHSVIRAGQSQSLEQMKSLLMQMDEHPLSSFCPHGRPVFVKRTFFDIEREFGRIV